MSVDYELENKKTELRRRIRFWLQGQMEDPVESNGIFYNAGADSGMYIDSARRLAIETGQTTVTITDSSNAPHTLTLEECLNVVIAIGTHFQTAFHQKQQWMTMVDNATTIEELPTIT